MSETSPPPKTVAVETRPVEGGGYRFTVVRVPDDPAKIVEGITGMMRDLYGYAPDDVEAARLVLEAGVAKGQLEFVFRKTAAPEK